MVLNDALLSTEW